MNSPDEDAEQRDARRGTDDAQPEATKTDHPTGKTQADENIEQEPAG
jgi:hypothetical protein